jgi:hypothetical protein
MRAVLAEEASGLIGRLGFQGAAWIRAVPIYLFLIGIFGIFLPWQRGRSFLDAVILGAYACLGVVFAAPSAASPFDGRPTIWKAGARVVISVVYGELLAVTMLLLGIITVYVSNGGRIVVGPNLQSLSECLVFGFMLSLALTTAAVWLSVRFSPTFSRGVVRLIFLGLVAAFYFRSGWLPAIALRGAGVGLAAFVLLFLGLSTTLSGVRRSETA